MNIPIFPLQLIVFPGESLNLHIFEQKYRQLFADLKSGTITFFGIPPVVDHQMHAFGTRLILTDIVKNYPGGEMDVSTKGIDVFKLGGILANGGQKLYAEATVDLITHDSSYDFLKFEELRGLYLEFQDLMAAQKEIDVVDGDGYSFKIAHYIGLSEAQKLALLEIVSEFDRQDYLIQHLKLIIPSMRNIKETQARITANGYFKNLKSFNFTQGES
jgi:Lon protease-like protein